MDHQTIAMRKAWSKTEFALFMEMGTGKTFTVIGLAGHRFNHEQIDAVLIICPTSIKAVWEWEVPKMSPVPSLVHVHGSGPSADRGTIAFSELKCDQLKYLVVGVEGLSQGKVANHALNFAKTHNCLVVVDESSRIKNADASRTKKAIRMGDSADYRMILTGTPITQGIIDLYGQFRFLGQHIIGIRSFFVFRQAYCIMGGFQGKKVLGYQREDELMDKIAPYIYQVKKEECLDLPDKVYTQLKVAPTKQQAEALKNLKDFFEHEQDGKILTAVTVLERMTRYQQILGGNFPFMDMDTEKYKTKPIEGKNPKLDALLDHLSGVASSIKVIIWARFRPEIELISKALREQYGEDSIIEYHGGISESNRKKAIIEFQDTGNSKRFFIANQQTAGMGITLTAATLAYYYSNSFSLEDRMQSEDRCHRKGQTHKVTYVDIWCTDPADMMIGKALIQKKDLATLVDEMLQERIKGNARSQ